MNLQQFLLIAIGMVFIQNFILSKFLGLCPFLGVSHEVKPAISMGIAVIFVMTFSSIITWLIYHYILIRFDLVYLRTIFFILVIATFVQLTEMVIQKVNLAIYKALGIYLPLITTNCAVLGVTFLNIDSFFVNTKPVTGSFLYSLSQGFFAGLGFSLVLLLMSSIRERLDLYDIPESLKGIPIAFITASIMSLAFMGFSGFRF